MKISPILILGAGRMHDIGTFSAHNLFDQPNSLTMDGNIAGRQPFFAQIQAGNEPLDLLTFLQLDRFSSRSPTKPSFRVFKARKRNFWVAALDGAILVLKGSGKAVACAKGARITVPRAFQNCGYAVGRFK
jgi:hypothetical protein